MRRWFKINDDAGTPDSWSWDGDNIIFISMPHKQAVLDIYNQLGGVYAVLFSGPVDVSLCDGGTDPGHLWTPHDTTNGLRLFNNAVAQQSQLVSGFFDRNGSAGTPIFAQTNEPPDKDGD